MDLALRVEEIIAPSLDAMGYAVVRVRMTGGTLQVMAERRDDGTMTVDDCAEISRTVSALLDVHDPVPGRYRLEVSSPGIDRPLVRPEDYDRFAGFEAKLDLKRLLDGRKRLKGRIKGREGDAVRIVVDGQDVLAPLELVSGARLVLTDDLIAAAQAKAAAAKV